MPEVTTSLEVSKQLKGAGIKQGYSEYFWSDHLANPAGEASGKVERMRLHKYTMEAHVPKELRWAAFTNEELGVILQAPTGAIGHILKDLAANGYTLGDFVLRLVKEGLISINAANKRLQRYRSVPRSINEHAGFPAIY